MKPTQTQFSAYQKIFDYFNKKLFEDNLPDCMPSFSRRRQSTHALFSPGQWRLESGPTKAEISLNLKQLREAETINVMATLVRQMVHLWQEMYSCPGCGTKVWGKGGLGLICECGGVFVDRSGRSKAGLVEKVCRILLGECGYVEGKSEEWGKRNVVD